MIVTPTPANTNGPQETPGAVSRDLNEAKAHQEMFLQVLVAQLRNQNPLNPADPMQFVSQLAQFSSLEQSIYMRQELTAIRESLAGRIASESFGNE
jgi:flagellar basal-body rod modification protein FlgD